MRQFETIKETRSLAEEVALAQAAELALARGLAPQWEALATALKKATEEEEHFLTLVLAQACERVN